MVAMSHQHERITRLLRTFDRSREPGLQGAVRVDLLQPADPSARPETAGETHGKD